MNTYTPKIGSMGEPWMQRDPQGGWVSLADHEEAMRQANADPNDIAWVSPPPEKVDHYMMITYAEHLENKSMRQELADCKRLIADHCDDEEKVRAILKEFDRSDTYGSDGSIVLAERAAEALKQARADRDVLAAEVWGWRAAFLTWNANPKPNAFFYDPYKAINATDASAALDRAKGGGA